MRKSIFKCVMVAVGIFTATVAQNGYGFWQDNSCGCESNFSGLYIGGNVGALTHVAHRQDLDGFLTDNAGWTTLSTDVAGGGQIGFDIQQGSKLVGIVADFQGARVHNTLPDDPNGANTPGIRTTSNWFSTQRLRAGLASNQALVYVTAGAAVVHLDATWDRGVDTFSFSDERWGWCGGFGTELKVWNNVTVGLEGLWMHFNDHDREFTTGGVAPATFRFRHSDSDFFGRFLVNYRFGNNFLGGLFGG